MAQRAPIRPIFALALALGVWTPVSPAAGQPTARDRQAELLARLDANGDGLLQPDEIPERARPALRRIAQQAGLPPNEPLPIARLARQPRQPVDRDDRPPRGEREDERGDADADRDDEDDREGRRGRRDSQDQDENDRRRRWRDSEEEDRPRQQPSAIAAKVPPFGVTTALPRVPGFDVPHSVTSQGGPTLAELEQSVDGRIVAFARRILERADENANQIVDPAEWEHLRWRGDANELDLNRDGRLTLPELIQEISRLREQSRERRGGEERGEPNQAAAAEGHEPSATGSAEAKPEREVAHQATDSQRRYASMVIRRHDANKNGRIDADERQQLSGDAAQADANGDGIITEDELLSRLVSGSRSSRQGRAEPRRDRGATPPRRERTRSAARGPSWFRSGDRNGDGQVAMSEYASSWDEGKVAEFAARDKDGDGVITQAEAAR